MEEITKTLSLTDKEWKAIVNGLGCLADETCGNPNFYMELMDKVEKQLGIEKCSECGGVGYISSNIVLGPMSSCVRCKSTGRVQRIKNAPCRNEYDPQVKELYSQLKGKEWSYSY